MGFKFFMKLLIEKAFEVNTLQFKISLIYT